MALRLLVIVFLAALHFDSFEASAQPGDFRTLGPQPDSFALSGPSAPLLKESAIKEEDLQEDLLENRPSAPARLGSPPSGGAPALPTVPDTTLPAGPVGESIGPQEELRQGSGAVPSAKEKLGSTIAPTQETASVQPKGPSLIAKITSQTPPRRAASLRLTEEGRRLLESGEYEKALERFEKTIALDSTNPYSYYYLAQAHHYLAQYRESFNFLDVAESHLSKEPYWLAKLSALKGKNFQALGAFKRADASYADALKLDPNNQAAIEAITQITVEEKPPLK